MTSHGISWGLKKPLENCDLQRAHDLVRSHGTSIGPWDSRSQRRLCYYYAFVRPISRFLMRRPTNYLTRSRFHIMTTVYGASQLHGNISGDFIAMSHENQWVLIKWVEIPREVSHEISWEWSWDISWDLMRIVVRHLRRYHGMGRLCYLMWHLMKSHELAVLFLCHW